MQRNILKNTVEDSRNRTGVLLVSGKVLCPSESMCHIKSFLPILSSTAIASAPSTDGTDVLERPGGSGYALRLFPLESCSPDYLMIPSKAEDYPVCTCET